MQLQRMLEVAGGVTLSLALGVSTVVQARVWRAIQGGRMQDEHEDYKIRVEARRLELKKQEVVKQEMILQQLEQAHEQMQKEQADVRAMHEHASKALESLDGSQDGQGDEDQARRSHLVPDSDRATFENPLQE